MSKSYLVNNITYEQRQLQLKYPCTDVGNMMRFINQHQKVIRCYGNSREWLIWDGTRWRRTSNKDIFSLALNSINSIAFEAKKCPSVEGTQALRKWLLTSQSEAKINAMINMASKHPNISVSLSQFDKLDNFLNCKKATINLNNGSTSKNDPLKSFTKVTNASYNKDAHCPTFKKFILDIFNGDNELIEWFQRAIGYTITGSTKEQLLFIAHGKGANGKSTLFELIRDILGDYAITSDFETFINNNNSEVRQMESIGELKGVRFVLASEVDPSVRFREALVKKLTGGDNLRGTKLRSSAFQFKPEFKIWLLCNHLPFARDNSYGFWRRIKVIPFKRVFKKDSIDINLPQKLKLEKEGILFWCIEGAVKWYEELKRSNGVSGLGQSKAVTLVTEQYQKNNDFISNFIQERVVKGEKFHIKARQLYEEFKAWCEKVGEKFVLAENTFSIKMDEHGFRKKRTKLGVIYLGVKLVEQN